MVSQVTPGGVSSVSICVVVKIIITKIKYMFGGFEFIRLKVPQYPLPIGLYLQKLMFKTCHPLPWYLHCGVL